VREAAAQAAAREHERTREWLESKGLPKAARVAQREAYNVLRKYGVVGGAARVTHAVLGRDNQTPVAPRTLTDDEITELAQVCLAMLEAQGRPVEVTLSEMDVTAGGFLLPEDAARVRHKINSLMGDSAAGPSAR
jgi:Flp pilus assembly protein CpaB